MLSVYKRFHQMVKYGRRPVILYLPIRLSGRMNKSMPADGINQYRVSPLKLKLDIKQNVNAKHLQYQCQVSGLSCGPSPYIFDIYLFFSADHSLKNWPRKLRTIALLVYFMVLNFDYGIQLSIILISKYYLIPVTFYPSVVIL